MISEKKLNDDIRLAIVEGARGVEEVEMRESHRHCDDRQREQLKYRTYSRGSYEQLHSLNVREPSYKAKCNQNHVYISHTYLPQG